MSLPINRTAKATLDSNLVNGILSDGPKIKASNDIVYDTIDELNNKVNTNYGAGATGTTQLADSSVTLAKMADSSVGTTELVDSSVTLAKMADSSVGTAELVDLSVTNGKVANGTLTATKFVAGVLTNETANGLLITALTTDLAIYKPSGVDDTSAIQTMLNTVGKVKLIGGTYIITNTITMPPDSSLIGLGDVVLRVDADIHLFKISRDTTLENFEIYANVLYTKNVIEISSATLQSVTPMFGDPLNNYIKDIVFNFQPNQSVAGLNGTVFWIWASATDELGVTYRETGFWGIHVSNCFVNGRVGYVCRNYSYLSGYITEMIFDHVTVNGAIYGWFGARGEADIGSTNYYDGTLKLTNCIHECTANTKRFAYFSHGSKSVLNCCPMDWNISLGGVTPYLLLNNVSLYTEKISIDPAYGTLAQTIEIYGRVFTTEYERSNFCSTILNKHNNVYTSNISPIQDLKRYNSMLASTIYNHRDVGAYSASTAVTGTIKIKLPVLYNAQMLRIKIKGFSLTTFSQWEATISGYLISAGSWNRGTAILSPDCPFTSIRSAYDGTNPYLLLGITTTVWQYPQIVISEVLAGFLNGFDFIEKDWAITLITDESTLSNKFGMSMRLMQSNDNGDTASRPTALIIGQMYFDTTLNKPIWWNGTVWKDAAGATV